MATLHLNCTCIMNKKHNHSPIQKFWKCYIVIITPTLRDDDNIIFPELLNRAPTRERWRQHQCLIVSWTLANCYISGKKKRSFWFWCYGTVQLPFKTTKCFLYLRYIVQTRKPIFTAQNFINVTGSTYRQSKLNGINQNRQESFV